MTFVETYPPHVTKQPINHNVRLIPLLSVALSTALGLIKIPVPTILFKQRLLIDALVMTSAEKRSVGRGDCIVNESF